MNGGWRPGYDGNFHRVDTLMRRGCAVAYEVRYRWRSSGRASHKTLGKLDVRSRDGSWEPVSVEEVDFVVRDRR